MRFNAESMDPDAGREAWIYDQLHAAMGEWTQFAADYNNLWKAGHERDPASLEAMRKQLTALRTKTDLPVLVHELAMFADDEAQRQRWINIGIVIGAALLAAASGGFASGAIGGVAGSIVGAGVESLTFTAITSTLNQDPTFGGFMAELALNFATFGGLRAISGGAKLLAGGRALTLPEKLGEMTVEGLWMVASATAQEKIEEAFAHGGTVTAQSAATIFGQQMALSFAARVLVRIGGSFIKRATSIKLTEVQTAISKLTEEENLARQVSSSGDGKLSEQLVKADTAALKAEHEALERVREVASNPAEAAKHGIKLEPGELERVTADAEGVARELLARELGELMQHVDVKADHAIAEPAVYSELLAKHRAQGSTIAEAFDSAGQPRATIAPRLADGSFGTAFTLHARLGDEVEKILAAKNLPNTAVIGDYLAKRSNDRTAALDDLRKVNTPAELDHLMKKTLGEDAVTARELAIRISAQEQLIRDVFGTSPSPETVRELAGVPGLGRPLLEQLAARGLPVAEQLGQSLAKVLSWPENARVGLVKLAASDTPDAIRLLAKVSPNVEIDGMNVWILLASRQLKEQSQLLDLEQSLSKAIEIRRFDPDVAVEVNYYKGNRVSRDELNDARAQPDFDKSQHVNVDVESSSERWEMKRVNPIITKRDKLLDQVNNGTQKYTRGRLLSLKNGGSKRNVVDVDFGGQLQIAGLNEAQIRKSMQEYIDGNPTVRQHVDVFVIHAELDGVTHDIRIDT